MIVIGGGPGGSTAASFLAKAGRSVLLLERERFPRFHIGESLLPYNRLIFRELGLLPKLEAAGLTRKYGAQFHLGNASKSIKLVFGDGKFTRETEAYQVERATFDEILLRHSDELGAETREGWTVRRFENEEDTVVVHATNPTGEKESFRCKFLVDASGRGNLTGNQEGLREFHPEMKKVAIFGHFSGVKRDPGPKAGDTVIIRLEHRWFWLIPIGPDKVSVGCVLDKTDLATAGQSPAELFEGTVKASEAMQERMADARLLGEIQTTTDFSYTNRRFYGNRLIRIGDAAGFMDPIFSAGVFIAMHTGKLAAAAISTALTENHDGRQLFEKYNRRIERMLQFYWKMARHFYTTPFMEVFLAPNNRFQLVAAVNAVLAGELEGSFGIRCRMQLFFWIVRLQQRWPLVPRIVFGALNPVGDSEPEKAMS